MVVLIFPENVAIYLLLPCTELWQLDLLVNSFPVFLQCIINVTLLFNPHASNMHCSLVNKYANDSNLADFFLLSIRGLLFVQTELK